jgi:hypothetical protein
LRDVKFIETEEILPNGKPIKISKYEAMQRILVDWSSFVRDGCFQKYGELVATVEQAAEKAIQFKPSDPDSEIERLQERIAEIKAQAEATKAMVSHADLVRQINEVGEPPAEPAPNGPPVAPEPVEPVKAPEPPVKEPEPPVVTGARQSVVPAVAPAPVAAQAAPQKPSQQAPQQPPRQYNDESLVGGDDLVAAVAAENQRLFDDRMAHGRTLPTPSGSVLDAMRHAQQGNRVPPHMAALDAAEFVQPAPKGKIQLDAPPQDRTNPRFRPPKP